MNTAPDYSHAEKLLAELSSPLFNPLLKKWVGRGELDYELYLKTPTLLSLQSPEAERIAHDELMFQLVHQAQELWLKLASRETVELVAELDGDVLWGASARLERLTRVLRTLGSELAVLETMTPEVYQVIRRSLGNGSGQESPGYNTFRHAAAGLEAALERLLERREQTLKSVYTPGGPEDLKRICEQLVDVDESFQDWLYAHFQLVRRTIGVDRTVKALDGLPTQVLVGRMTLPLFRQLWDVRVELTAAWRREGGMAPGTERSGCMVGERSVHEAQAAHERAGCMAGERSVHPAQAAGGGCPVVHAVLPPVEP
ncbi:tryptophan 2,3-dioxygenase family protein [Pyxidicoccus xibeiensis]|uniref:tryptophan 2,3-dioxygenase family protein n=1 Tax=Pyxidicoccus xibeiensis TaxID=2906759 RepID=UPI0020A71A85|nr:tryptophan 2,3-dioxygenase family protein [Pyxidicoccus xibeiensis]MCP3136113.1 tryptophan 2,3-dioxygenase family protein [Pyxidicoccus xibeiensis]